MVKRGYKFSKESRLKMSLAQRGRVTWMKGKHHTEESKRKMSISKIGMYKGKKNPMYGKKAWNRGMKFGPRTDEVKLKISLKKKGTNCGKKNHFYGKRHTIKFKNHMKRLWKTKDYLEKQFHNGNRYKNNKCEKAIQTELKNRGIDFITHKTIIGVPDIFIEPNICIFIDGDFFHGNPNIYNGNHIIGQGTHKMKAKEKWKYDKSVTRQLKYRGYIILRFWESDIKKDVKSIVDKIERVIHKPF